MATWEDVERIAAELPETAPRTAWGRPAFGVAGKVFVVDRGLRSDAVDEAGERIPGLVTLFTADLETKDQLAADDSGHFLTTPHFDNRAAILVRLAAIPVDELREVVVESWLAKAPKRLAAAYLETLEDHG